MSASLFSPLQLGAVKLAHRVVMAPLTRMRAAQPGNVPMALNAAYYAQRATQGGFIISEATQIRPDGQGSPATPGIHSAEQVEGWKAVTAAVHAKGGIIFAQLWHVGRVSHSSHHAGGALPVAPSAIGVAAPAMAMTAQWKREPFETPRALATEEIAALVQDYAQAARNALAAGFDGVEIHAANGYLIEQFMQKRSNLRADVYGGSIENRCRLLLEVATAVAGVCGADRVGVRLSPYGIANGSGEDEPVQLYSYAIKQLAALKLAYLHLLEPRASGAGQADVNRADQPSAAALFRPLWPTVLIAAGNFDPASAAAMVADGHADAIAFGRFFISNPDLPQRIRGGAALTPYNRATFYGGGEEGYTDYPALATT